MPNTMTTEPNISLISLKDSCNISEEYVGELKFNKTVDLDQVIICLYGSLIEFSTAIYTIAESRTLIAIDPIFRCILEIYVDLKNLLDDNSYLYHMQFSYHQEWLNVLQNSQSGNPYLSDLANMDNLNEEIMKISKEKKDIKKQGGKHLNVYQRFKLAGMVDEYNSIYNFLCCESHNNIRALINRHIDIDREQNDFQINIHHTKGSQEFNHYYVQTAKFLLTLGEKVHLFFESNCAEKITEKIEALNKTAENL